MEEERKARILQEFCNRTVHEMEELELEAGKESEERLPGSQASMANGFPGREHETKGGRL